MGLNVTQFPTIFLLNQTWYYDNDLSVPNFNMIAMINLAQRPYNANILFVLLNLFYQTYHKMQNKPILKRFNNTFNYKKNVIQPHKRKDFFGHELNIYFSFNTFTNLFLL